MNGAVSDALIAAYKRTLFRIKANGTPADLRIGRRSAVLAQLMRESGVVAASIITAYNPFSQVVAEADNKRAHAELIAAVELLDVECCDSAAVDPDDDWPVEHGLLLLGIHRREAIALARRFKQNAIVCIGPDAVPALVLCR